MLTFRYNNNDDSKVWFQQLILYVNFLTKNQGLEYTKVRLIHKYILYLMHKLT